MPYLKMSKPTGLRLILAVAGLAVAGNVVADNKAYQRCLQEQLQTVKPDTPVTKIGRAHV